MCSAALNRSAMVDPTTPGEYMSLILASLLMVIVLVACFMCIQLFHLHKPAAAAAVASQ